MNNATETSPGTTSMADLLAAANVTVEVTGDAAPAPSTPAPAKRGVPVGTKRVFPINLAAFSAIFAEVAASAAAPKKEGDPDWNLRLSTLNLLKEIPQQITTEIPRTREEIMALLAAEMEDAKKENRIPDLEMIGGLGTRKVNAVHKIDEAAEDGIEEIQFTSSGITEYFSNKAKQLINALHKISEEVEKKKEEIEAATEAAAE